MEECFRRLEERSTEGGVEGLEFVLPVGVVTVNLDNRRLA